MTKHEKKLKAMLNYYEIDLKGKKNEKMSSRDLTRFIDTFNRNYDINVISDIISKLKGDNNSESEDNDQMDYFSDNLDSDSDMDDNQIYSKDDTIRPLNNRNINEYDKNDPINSDVNSFLKWLTLVLYSADHTVSITSSGKSIVIKLVKIDKGKK
jgi:hypothetical protein